jgi:hypothetical protein
MIRLTTTAITGNFIQDIKTEQGVVQFNFLRKNTPWIDKYFILALDRNLKPHWFSMIGQESIWVIVEGVKVAKWIRDVEDQLSEAIVTYNHMN